MEKPRKTRYCKYYLVCDREEENMEKPRKTRYCKYYLICDREEDCFAGEACPVQEPNTYVPACICDLPWAERAFEDHEMTARKEKKK